MCKKKKIGNVLEAEESLQKKKFDKNFEKNVWCRRPD